MKVIIVIPCEKEPHWRCLKSAMRQGVKVHIERLKGEKLSSHPDMNKSLNSTRTRNAARTKLLYPWWKRKLTGKNSEYSHVLWLDSDTVLPDGAVESFMRQKFDAQAGWYQARYGSFSAGRWVADNTIGYFTSPWQDMTHADWAGLGCFWMSTKYLHIPFVAGVDRFCRDSAGSAHWIGPSIAYCNALNENGVKHIMMHGNVVCEHLV